MELVEVQNTKFEWSRLERLYTRAFPAEERFPFSLLKKRAISGKADFWNLVEGGEWVGMAYLVRKDDLVYLFYFAVDAEKRGLGHGTSAIKAMLEHYRGNRFFLALEDWLEECENPEERVKRHNFYLNCGLNDIPYKLKELTMTYRLMGVGGKVEPDEYKAMMGGYFGWFWKHFIKSYITKE